MLRNPRPTTERHHEFGIAIVLVKATGAAVLTSAACGGERPASGDGPTGTAKASLATIPNTPDGFVRRFDRNQDGLIEIATEAPPKAKSWLRQADADHDGKVGVDELSAEASAWFARTDTDGSGTLTAAEIGPRRWSFLQVADKDGDGALTRAEFESSFAQGKLLRTFE